MSEEIPNRGEERLNSSPEKTTEKDLGDASTLQELYGIINARGELVDSDGKRYTAKKLKSMIYSAVKGSKPVEELPDIDGLRERVGYFFGQHTEREFPLDKAENYPPPKPKKPSLREYWGKAHK